MGKAFSMVAIRRRIATLLFAALAVFAALALRLAYLQLVRAGQLGLLADQQRLRPVPILPARGTIYDRRLQPLAVSLTGQAIYAVPIEVRRKEETARALAPIVGLGYEELLARLSTRQALVWLRRQAPPEVARRVQELGLPGIGVVERPERFYPHGELAGQILGFVGIDNQGLEGLERYYDEALRGRPGMILQERDATGRLIPGGSERRVPPQNGKSLVLTIDATVQAVVERELEKAVLETLSEFGMAVVVNPRTGDILAVATYPGFDPNHFADYPSERRRNRPITDQFEPGSTFKIVTGAAALEAGVTRLDEVFVDPVVLVKWGGRVSCWSHGHGTQTFVQATENSCNPVFAILGADRLGPQKFYQLASAFGFGRPLGVDFPGEGSGTLPRPGAIKHGELLAWANIGFGQTVAVTPLQLVMAAATIANEGVLMRPRFVRAIGDPATGRLEEIPPQPIRRVLSPQVARDFAGVMRSVVLNGSGRQAEVPGYRVAGKTGTAQIPRPGGGYIDKNMASFVGFAPVDDPEVAAIIMLYKVGVYPSWGGMRAAPVFRRMMEQILPYLGVTPRFDPADRPRDPPLPGQPVPQPPPPPVPVPDVRNLARTQAESRLRQAGFTVVLEGEGDYVLSQVPGPEARVQPGATVFLELYDPAVWRSRRQRRVTVPDLRGNDWEEAAHRLADVGLLIAIEGQGRAVRQEPAAGTAVPSDTVVKVYFEPQTSPLPEAAPSPPAPGQRPEPRAPSSAGSPARETP